MDDRTGTAATSEGAPMLVWSQPQLPGLPPSPRGAHTATVAGNHLFVFGGQDTGEGGKFAFFNDVVVLDLEQWTWYNHKARGSIPPPRYGHTMTLIGNKLLLLFGRGEGGKKYSRTVHFLDPFTLTWYETNITGHVPPGRFNHSATLYRTQLYVFGGHNGKDSLGDMQMLDIETWTWSPVDAEGRAPQPRHGHTATLVGNEIFYFAGYADDSKNPYFLDDMRIFNIETETWSRPYTTGTPPTPRYKHTMTLVGETLLLFGGFGGTSRCALCGAINYGSGNATHDPECVVGLSNERNNPANRKSQTAMSNRSKASGGSGDASHTGTNTETDLLTTTPLDYFCALDLRSMEWSRPPVAGLIPSSRFGHSTNLFPHGLVVFGGWDGRSSLDDLLVLHIDAM
eukprot:GFYU01001461.1.p1 GENE.GFYU01001461.1~~GFYU01001461.1.p1  ORF type:complete len:398 (-),score=92.02 GFYU01001461.1:174-1367(-)